jgi:hypothetical protein
MKKENCFCRHETDGEKRKTKKEKKIIFSRKICCKSKKYVYSRDNDSLFFRAFYILALSLSLTSIEAKNGKSKRRERKK